MMFKYDKKWEHQFCTNFIWKQNCDHGNCTMSIILHLIWCTLQVPSLKSTALIFLKIFYILWLSSFGTTGDITSFLTKTWISPEWEAIFQKQEHHSSFILKAFQISFIYFLLHRHFKLNVLAYKELSLFVQPGLIFICWPTDFLGSCSLILPKTAHHNYFL